MGKAIGLGLGLFAALAIAVACGSDDDSGLKGSGGKGGSDSGKGGTSASGGGGTSAGGSAGSAAGGSAGIAAGGSAGGEAGPPPCDPPTDTNKAALCLQIAPETIKFVDTDKALDGSGVLYIEVFDVAQPDQADGGTIQPIAVVAAPTQISDAGITEGKLADLVKAPYRFEVTPTTVHVRAFFVDDLTVFQSTNDSPQAGTWIGGYDLTSGLGESLPIQPIALTTGVGTFSSMPLTALRKLTVTVSRSVAPAGDAQGPLGIVVLPSASVSPTTQVFGVGALPCADLSGTQTAIVNGFVIGTGPAFVTGVLDDLGAGGDLPPGALASLEIQAGKVQIPAGNKLNYPPSSYAISSAIALGFLNQSQGNPDNAHCGGPTDAATD